MSTIFLEEILRDLVVLSGFRIISIFFIIFIFIALADTIVFFLLTRELSRKEKDIHYWRDQAIKMNSELKNREELKEYDKVKLKSQIGFHYFYNAIMHVKDIPNWESNPDLAKAVENYEMYLRGNKE